MTGEFFIPDTVYTAAYDAMLTTHLADRWQRAERYLIAGAGFYGRRFVVDTDEDQSLVRRILASVHCWTATRLATTRVHDYFATPVKCEVTLPTPCPADGTYQDDRTAIWYCDVHAVQQGLV